MDLVETKGSLPFGEQSITFYESGKSKNNNTIILIHGTGGTSLSHYYNIFPMLAVHQKVLSIDLVNKSEGDLTLDDYFSQVDALIKTLPTDEKITLVGYSLGSIVAAYTASKLSNKVTKLVMLCGWYKTTSSQKFYHQIIENLFNEKSAALTQTVVLNAFSEKYLSQLSNAQIDRLAKSISITAEFLRQNLLNNTVDLTNIVNDISAETLIINGVDDRLVPVNQGRLLYASIENSRLALINSGHVINVEAAPQVVQLINNFNKNSDFYPKNTVISNFQP